MEEIEMTSFQKDTVRIIDAIVSSKQAVLLKDRERVLVKIVPVVPDEQGAWLGCMRDKGKVIGDIVSPAEDENPAHSTSAQRSRRPLYCCNSLGK